MANKAPGAYENHEESTLEAQDMQPQGISNGVLKGLEPINFEDKIMGGQKAKHFMSGKLTPTDDSGTYTDKVEAMLGNTGGFSFGSTFNNHIENILGGSGNSNADDKISKILGGSSKGSGFNFDINTKLGFGGMAMKPIDTSDKINSFLGMTPKDSFKKSKKGKAAVQPINPMDKINSAFSGMNMNMGFGPGNGVFGEKLGRMLGSSVGGSKQQVNNTTDKIMNAFGGFGMMERQAAFPCDGIGIEPRQRKADGGQRCRAQYLSSFVVH